MTGKKKRDFIISEKALAILRMKADHHIPDLVAALVEGGIKVLEITSNTPNFSKHIEQARKQHSQVLVGAGTILTGIQAKQAIDCGAQFLVTPNTNIEIIKEAVKSDIPSIVGALTPTEIAQAVQAGADIIKLFPASFAGIEYMRAVKGPFDNLKIFAVGGINLNNAGSWLKAGAAGVGIGSQLLGIGQNGQPDIDQTRNNAKSLKKILQTF